MFTMSDADDVLRELFSVVPTLQRMAHEGLERRNLTPPRLRTLLLLDDGGPQMMSTLAKGLSVTPRAVTALVDALEQDGLVRRSAQPDDRRVWVVDLTAPGRRLVRDVRTGHRRLAARLLGDVPAADLAATLRVLTGVRSTLEHA